MDKVKNMIRTILIGIGIMIIAQNVSAQPEYVVFYSTGAPSNFVPSML